ncbi:SIMPL domain-containing protein [Actinoplanes oblitus]|uniref:SIMPL domain-containing protein n=1 Tax=Actinoplanes oblitus TaxID=3040509 RepID=A0ABY8W8M6_9ACTN|nr:SIMPL domain-containing protein [Actinoplanes oblitus]WIM93408.1 SIMPL domain-containing protein [Actinoplanes oblitus]
MSKSRVTVPAVVALLALAVPSSSLLPAGPAAASAGTAATVAADRPAWESVLVTGTGEVFGEPDTLTANLAVEATAGTVAEALDRAAAAATRMRDALVRGGVAKADMQTSDVSVSVKRNEHNEITGYTVTHGLTAKIRNLGAAGATISAAVTAGGDAARLNGMSFAIENDTALLVEARRKAFADARAKADLYAREAGRPLGRVLRVSEETPSYRGSAVQYSVPAADAAMPVEPGRQQLAVTVTVEWALGPQPARSAV